MEVVVLVEGRVARAGPVVTTRTIPMPPTVLTDPMDQRDPKTILTNLNLRPARHLVLRPASLLPEVDPEVDPEVALVVVPEVVREEVPVVARVVVREEILFPLAQVEEIRMIQQQKYKEQE